MRRAPMVLAVLAVAAVVITLALFKIKIAILGAKYLVVLIAVLLLLYWLSTIFGSRDRK